MFETSNDLPSMMRRSAVEMLNEHLADAIDLYLQAKQAHWNIKGPNFVGLHSHSIGSPLTLVRGSIMTTPKVV